MKSTPKEILKKIARSPTFQEYERAFQEMTGLPLAITPPETWGLPQHGQTNENTLCALIASDPKACAGCLVHQKKLSNDAGVPTTMKCFAGMTESAVPVRVNGEVIGLLQTGQIIHEQPTRKGFYALKEKLNMMGAQIEPRKLEKAFFGSPVMEASRYRAALTLLRHFSSHLELVANCLMMEGDNTEAPIIQRARTYIEENYSENITLKEIAAAVHTSTFYFCKIFRKGTGITFTEYLTRVRIEKAKAHLANPHLRVSEIAFEVGFQSLSQFNRAFKGLTGRSPSEFRANPPRALVA